jgi:hypothetical protein
MNENKSTRRLRRGSFCGARKRYIMVRSCCLAGIEGDKVAILSAALRSAGAPLLSSVESLSVTRLGQLRPDLCICDLDGAEGDPLETLRQIRFVRPIRRAAGSSRAISRAPMRSSQRIRPRRKSPAACGA